MKKLLLFLTFIFANLTILSVVILILTLNATKKSLATEPAAQEQMNLIAASYDSYSALPSPSEKPQATIVVGDARTVLVDDFFKRYSSPMYGLGFEIVEAADRYQIPFGILPAIAQCESNLGKVMPYDSFNPWGFGIYTGLTTRFTSWHQAIDTVSRTLAKEYFGKGLDTPDKIMKKYTPSSNGSWAFCVNKFMEELK